MIDREHTHTHTHILRETEQGIEGNLLQRIDLEVGLASLTCVGQASSLETSAKQLKL